MGHPGTDPFHGPTTPKKIQNGKKRTDRSLLQAV
jgi:hypothetical protein